MNIEKKSKPYFKISWIAVNILLPIVTYFMINQMMTSEELVRGNFYGVAFSAILYIAISLGIWLIINAVFFVIFIFSRIRDKKKQRTAESF